MLTVVGVDPGGVTGWCALRVDPDAALAAGEGGSVLAGLVGCWLGQIGGPEVDHVDAVLAAVYGESSVLRGLWHADEVVGGDIDECWEADCVVTEAFVLRAGLNRGAASKTETLSPVRVSFGIEYALHSCGWDGILVQQSPGDAKAVVTDERLREWGLWVGPKDRKRHQRDAQRHALLRAKKLLSMRER